ncbi:hypothetical protein K239x_40650 [Planctomycetes bacterium K23_9]|uniref:Uncharacterized protein n=2 Tax=Stieleria marina TaxID=1930275 RepID=A0A517NY54_9BACT|nr:hypothetical protein K239x_40650 [Planctomycetes bacterium K23_9]
MIRASYDPRYFRRFLWVALVCMAYSLWCCYDAWVAYPAKGEVALAYEAVKAKFDGANPEPPQDDMLDLGFPRSQTKWLATWEAVAKENGWPPEPPEKTAKEIGEDIGKQYFMMVLCGLVGVPSLIKWWRGQGTWVEGDESTIRNSRGKELQIANIVKIDKRKWEDKGIAKIHFLEKGDRKKVFVMDDFKFQREPMAKIMAFAEANLTPEQIIGGATDAKEPPAEEDVS